MCPAEALLLIQGTESQNNDAKVSKLVRDRSHRTAIQPDYASQCSGPVPLKRTVKVVTAFTGNSKISGIGNAPENDLEISVESKCSRVGRVR